MTTEHLKIHMNIAIRSDSILQVLFINFSSWQICTDYDKNERHAVSFLIIQILNTLARDLKTSKQVTSTLNSKDVLLTS